MRRGQRRSYPAAFGGAVREAAGELKGKSEGEMLGLPGVLREGGDAGSRAGVGTPRCGG